ncbi:MAG: hypothetical protein MJ252_15160, partial [archaeon]|nr:hypothetical protein [archaeon]
MASNYKIHLDKELSDLSKDLVCSFFNLQKTDVQTIKYSTHVAKKLNQNSTLYLRTPKEIQQNFYGIVEKFEISSQTEKATLLSNYMSRLKTIFEKKSTVDTNNLFNCLSVILDLALPKEESEVNVEEMLKNFEKKYTKTEGNKFTKRKDYIEEVEDIKIEKTFEFPEVDYNEPTPVWSEDEGENIDGGLNGNNMDNQVSGQGVGNNPQIDSVNNPQLLNSSSVNNNSQNNNINNSDNNQSKTQSKTQNQIKNFSEFFDKNKYFFDNLTQSFPAQHTEYYNNMPFTFYDHLLKANERLNIKFGGDDISYVDNDFILNRILILFKSDPKTNPNQNFIQNFSNLSSIEFSSGLQKSLLEGCLKSFYEDLTYLRTIDLSFKEKGLSQLILPSHFLYVIKNLFVALDFIFAHMMELIYYQKGKIERYEHKKIIQIPIESMKQNKAYINFNYLNQLLKSANEYLLSFSENNLKFSLLKFINFYSANIQPIIKFYSMIAKAILKIKTSMNDNTNKSNALLVKNLLDLFYIFCHQKGNLYMIETFVFLLKIYLKFLNELFLNGNLIDLQNEFFIVKPMNNGGDKILFFFDERYKVFSWLECFKMKKYKGEGGEARPCVPAVFLGNKVYLKILEAVKVAYLLKNLNDPSISEFFTELKKEYFTEEENINSNENNNQIVNKTFNEGNDSLQIFGGLENLNKNLTIFKEEIILKGKELRYLKFSQNDLMDRDNRKYSQEQMDV